MAMNKITSLLGSLMVVDGFGFVGLASDGFGSVGFVGDFVCCD